MLNMIRYKDDTWIHFLLFSLTPMHDSHYVYNRQFFLGDYRPLAQDTHGNVVDQVKNIFHGACTH